MIKKTPFVLSLSSFGTSDDRIFLALPLNGQAPFYFNNLDYTFVE